MLAREVHQRLHRKRAFAEVYEHFAANLAFWGALALIFEPSTRLLGAAVLLAVALLIAIVGLRRSRESFVVYAIGYTTLGACALEAQLLRDPVLIAVAGLATITLSAWLLWRMHAQLRASRT